MEVTREMVKTNGQMPAVIEESEPSISSDTASSREKIAPEEPESSSYIPLQRVIVTMQYSKQNNATVLMEGWMVHYTQRNPVVSCNLLLLYFYDSVLCICIFHLSTSGHLRFTISVLYCPPEKEVLLAA